MQQPQASASCNDLTDIEIARRIAAGDTATLEQLMRKHNQKLYRTARSILKDDAEAEDAVQEAYVLAYRAIDRFRAEAKLSTWLIRIVVNEAIARVRKRNRSAEVIEMNGDLTEFTEQNAGSTNVSLTQSPNEQPEDAILRAQVRHLIEEKIDQLPDVFRTVFVLRGVEELTVAEAADCLSIPETTVRTRFFRAKGMLREALAREIDFTLEDAFSFAGDRCDRIVAGALSRLKAVPPADA